MLELAPPALKSGPAKNLDTNTPTLAANNVDHFLALRGVACLIVLVGHAIMQVRNPVDHFSIGDMDLNWLLRPNAPMGMYIFFTLSGYLMGNQFFSGKYRLSLKGILSFCRARVMRIAPLFYALTLFYLIYDGVDFLRDFHPKELARILTFTYSIWPFDWSGEHFWSIATEMQFYAIVPALFFVCRKFCKNGYFLAASLIGVLFFVEYYRVQAFFKCLLPGGALEMSLYHRKIYYPLIGNFDAFFVGFWLNMFYQWLDEPSNTKGPSQIKESISRVVQFFNAKASTKLGSSRLFVAWSAIFLCWIPIAWLQQNDPMELIALQYGVLNLLTAFTTALFIMIARGAEHNTQNARLDFAACSKNPFRLLECVGVLSYGIYLWHISIMAFLAAIIIKANTLSDYFWLIGCTTVVTILFATVTYLGIEKPINQMRYKLSAN